MAKPYDRMVTSQSEKDLKRLDDATVCIVQGINILLTQAQSEHLGVITAILNDARQSIAWWAAYDNYAESSAETLVHLAPMKKRNRA